MSGPPKSVWLAVHPSPWYSTYAHASQSGAEYAADKTASYGTPRPAVARYDLADPERDAREAEAIDRVLGMMRYQSRVADDDQCAIDRVFALRDRLKGDAR